ncbi:MAG TPA: hypothetical protein VD767_02000 [Thermomicrobiales bacterium]|nr:hypothetical protein [Thermomicrobiales bacterium]
MYTDPKQTYQLFQLEHDLRIEQAERGYVADQVASQHGHHPVATAIGKRVGHAMVGVGERLQGTPRRPAATGSAPALRPGGQA